MSDLASRLLSAIQERKALAEATSEGDWYTVGDLTGTTEAKHTILRADAPFIAALSPATVLRQVERDGRVLERHCTYIDDERGAPVCAGCGQFEPCDDKIDLAHAYAIPTEDGS